jgi:hypothetical protein
MKQSKEKLLIFVLYSLCSIFSFGQKEYYIPIRGEHKEVLLRVDSLSYKEKSLSSEFYVDSITQIAYTGKAIIYYGKNALDSINLQDGLKSGWQKLYFSKEEEYRLGKLEFYDQTNYIFISHVINKNHKSKNSSFIRYLTETNYYFLEVIYKPSGNMIVKQSIQSKTGILKQKFRLKSIEKLDEFLKQHKSVYEHCKKAGFFSKPNLE